MLGKNKQKGASYLKVLSFTSFEHIVNASFQLFETKIPIFYFTYGSQIDVSCPQATFYSYFEFKLI